MNRRFPVPLKVKALIIDDETDICYLLGNILKQHDIQSECAGSLAEAGKYLGKPHDYSIIFLDNHLPDGYGLSLVKQLREENPQAHLIMISAHDTGSDRQKAAGNGVDQFIGKPFSTEVILKTIDKFSDLKTPKKGK
jgi:two-component system, OmpR family, response regulator